MSLAANRKSAWLWTARSMPEGGRKGNLSFQMISGDWCSYEVVGEAARGLGK
jgi:hypothetical protein